MRKGSRKAFLLGIGFITVFIIWTLMLQAVDAKTIGPNGSVVGFSTINRCFNDLTGSNMLIYTVTDWMGLIPIFVAFGFAVLGLVQWIKRKSILKVDASLLVLGGFYITVIITYLFFEGFVINYRPILINGYLEPSYPSSTTLLVTCVMPTAIMQFNDRIHKREIRIAVSSLSVAFVAFMVIARAVCGVHWLTDIVGGAFISAGLVLIYYSLTHKAE